MVGSQTALQLSKYFVNLDNFMNTTLDDLKNIPDIGDKVANSVFSFVNDSNNIYRLKELLRAGVNIDYEESVLGPWTGKTVCITGTFSSFTRNELKDLIESQGGAVVSQVSKNTNILIVGDNPGSKLDKAKILGVKIMLEDDIDAL